MSTTRDSRAFAPAARRRRVAVAAPEIRASLSRPEFYPARPDRVEVRETHISWVFLAGERAYKLKKPLQLPFLDYRTRQRRRQMCREEVRLNRRMAPDVYLGVRAVARAGAGFALAREDDPRAVDYLVEMRRYDEASTLAAKLRRGELKREEVVALAGRLAQFHERVRRVPAVGVPSLAVERRMSKNFHELLAIVEQRAEVDWVLELERFTHGFVAAHGTLLDARARRGLVREGHGDLRGEHVLLDGTAQIVDCIEFDAALRELDVADDVAFLVMDLVASGGERFARTLVEAYRQAGGDLGEDSLIAFYASHRALVRAKIALLRAAQQPSGSSSQAHARATARELLGVGERFAWQARLPLVIVICGLPAAGKSHLARALADLAHLPHLSSDVTRKRLAGTAPGRRAGNAAYSVGFNRLTYAALGRRAASEAVRVGGAVVDATFRHRGDRAAFTEAFADAAPLLFVECRAPTRVLAERAARRDATPAVSPTRRWRWCCADLRALLDRRIGRGYRDPVEPAKTSPIREAVEMPADSKGTESSLAPWEVQEVEAAAREAAAIGGRAGDEHLDPAQRPLVEAGEGVAEGFELAEEELIEAATHGESRVDPLTDRFSSEGGGSRLVGEYGEADHEDSSELPDSDR